MAPGAVALPAFVAAAFDEFVWVDAGGAAVMAGVVGAVAASPPCVVGLVAGGLVAGAAVMGAGVCAWDALLPAPSTALASMPAEAASDVVALDDAREAERWTACVAAVARPGCVLAGRLFTAPPP